MTSFCKEKRFGFEYWQVQDVTLPFELKVTMPTPDMGKRGYSNLFVTKAK